MNLSFVSDGWNGPRRILHCLLFAAGCAIYFPMLAQAPQDPDGAEMVMAALSGGVLHAPGFPLQAWLDRLFISLPLGSPSFRLSLLSALCGVLSLNVILEILLTQGVRWSAIALALGVAAFFPTSWYLFVQPEKYGLTHLLLLLVVAQAFRGRGALATGIFFGLALVQHTMALVVAPFFLASVYQMVKEPRGRGWKLGWVIGSFIAIFVGFHLSLFSLTSPTAWPDWGKLQVLSDLVPFLSRADFRNLHAAEARQSHLVWVNALEIFAQQYAGSLALAGVLPLIGLWKLFREGSRNLAICFASSIALATVFLFQARLTPDGLVAQAYLQRYHVPLMGLVALLFGFGAQWLLDRVRRPTLPFFQASLLWVPAFLFWRGYPVADASRDSTCDLFREALALTFDAKAVYFAGTDLEFFYGIPTQTGIRFPLVGEYPWLIERGIAILDPRLQSVSRNGITTTHQFMERVYQRGYSVMVSNPEHLRGSPTPIVQKGLLYFAQKKSTNRSSPETLQGGLRVCTVLEKIQRPRPTEGFSYGRYLFAAFPLVYEGVANHLLEEGDFEGERVSRDIAAALRAGESPTDWQTGCQKLRRLYADRH